MPEVEFFETLSHSLFIYRAPAGATESGAESPDTWGPALNDSESVGF